LLVYFENSVYAVQQMRNALTTLRRLTPHTSRRGAA